MTNTVKFSQLPGIGGNIAAGAIIPITQSGDNYSVSVANLQTFINSTTGNVTCGNISVTGAVTASTISTTGNVTGGNISTAGSVAAGSVSAAGNITGGNLLTSGAVSATGNITANYFFGNGSQLTGLPATYGNANVAAYLPTYTGNLAGGNAAITSAITAATVSASGNITGNYILGNGSQLTGLPATYSNSNVSSFMAAFGSNTISTSGNITCGNITATKLFGDGSALTGITANAVLQGNLQGNLEGNGFGANAFTFVNATGNVTGSYIKGNGAELTGLVNSIIAGAGISISAATGNITITNNNPTAYGNANVSAYLLTANSNIGTGPATSSTKPAVLWAGGINANTIQSFGQATLDSVKVNTGVTFYTTTKLLPSSLTVAGTGDFSSNVTVNNLNSNGAVTGASLNITGIANNASGNTLLGIYTEKTSTLGNTGGTVTPGMSATVQRWTANSNFTLNLPTGMTQGQTLCLIIQQDGSGNRVMTPNASYKFAGGINVLSTTANAIDVMTIFYDGTNYLCNLVRGYV